MEDTTNLQTDLNGVKVQSDRWLVSSNTDKCEMSSYIRKLSIESKYLTLYHNASCKLNADHVKMDLRVYLHIWLNEQANEKTNEAKIILE